MTSKDTSEYPAPSRDEYSDEDSGESRQTRYPGADERPGWMETDTTTNFIERIRGLDSRLAHNIDQRLDLTMEAPARMEAVIDSFKSTGYENASEDINSISDVTKAIFQPIRDHMEYGEQRKDDPSEMALDQRLGQLELTTRQYTFEVALRGSRDDPEGRERYSAQMERAVYEPLSYPRERDDEYAQKLLDWLKRNEAGIQKGAIQEIVESKMAETDNIYQEEMRREVWNKGLMGAVTMIYEEHDRNLSDAVQRSDPEAFRKIMGEFQERDQNLAQEIGENAGFITMPAEERPDLSQGLTTLAQKEEFVNRINHIAENFNNPEHISNPDMRNSLAHHLNRINANFTNIKNPEDPQDIEYLNINLYFFEQSAESLKYITRPRDPEFWKLLDQPDEAAQDTMIGKLTQDRTQNALELINGIHDQYDRPREAALTAHSAMAHVCAMNIKSDLIDQDLPSFKEHLEDIGERSNQFALAVLDGTGFIESLKYEEPVFPQWADQSGSYLAAVNDKLQELNLADEIETDHYKAITYMLDRYNQTTYKSITIDVSEQKEEYQNIMAERGDLLRGIRILMKPRE